jgi:hypothetical protein
MTAPLTLFQRARSSSPVFDGGAVDKMLLTKNRRQKTSFIYRALSLARRTAQIFHSLLITSARKNKNFLSSR